MSDHEDFVRALEETSSRYAEKTTRLSRLISRIDSILSNLPGKTEADVGKSNDILKFHRGQHGWELEFSCCDEDGDRHSWVAVDAPVWVKVRVAVLLPALLDKLTSHQSEQLKSVESGLEAIESIRWIDADAEEEIAKEEEERAKQNWPPNDGEVPF